jgi:hypothetical protein
MDFDIVIPIGPNDIEFIHEQIKYTKKNIIGYRKIYLISYDPTLSIDNCITINENIFPFSLKTISNFFGESKHNGWYLQQLFKLYSGFIIPDILDKYLVIDCDTIFLKPTIFIENNKCLYNYGNEYYSPYFQHMSKLDNNFTKQIYNKSGICHHMIFEQKYINEIMNIVENNHNDKFYNIFLKCVDTNFYKSSGASEYELYFNYIIKYHNDNITIRPLKWLNSNIIITENNNFNDYDYISCHHYIRNTS